MKTIYNLAYIFIFIIAGSLLTGCKDDNKSKLDLDGSTMINALRLDDYDAVIDNKGKKAVVNVPSDYDLSAMTLRRLDLEPGAEADMKIGETLDCSVPRNIRITNGDVVTNYTLTVARDNVEINGALLNGRYAGSIDNAARTIIFFVPLDEDVETSSLSFTAPEGTTFDPVPGTVLDLTDPVTIKATYRTCTVSYTVTAIKDDMSQDPKAFIGNAESIEGLGDEAKAAAEWMMANVPNSRYVALAKVLDGSEKLGDYKMIWCHLDFTDWPGIMWDTRDIFNDYYIKGGNILATRDGARYINDVWRIAKDQQSPNNMFGGDFYETLENDLGFSVAGYETHPLYNGLTPDENGRIMLLEKGVSCSNRTLQWVVDWDAYGDMSVWETKTGATALATDGDANHVHIAEFAPRDILDGYQSGRVVTIGTPGYEWHDPNHAANQYRENIYTLTKNAINYLCK
ncbi:MAG: DUF4960 domain-containing protein [Muribaculaceae bacterium]|nr:DUF4960 domain-containing protein [Muribaculaceae bacterium]